VTWLSSLVLYEPVTWSMAPSVQLELVQRPIDPRYLPVL